MAYPAFLLKTARQPMGLWQARIKLPDGTRNEDEKLIEPIADCYTTRIQHANGVSATRGRYLKDSMTALKASSSFRIAFAMIGVCFSAVLSTLGA